MKNIIITAIVSLIVGGAIGFALGKLHEQVTELKYWIER